MRETSVAKKIEQENIVARKIEDFNNENLTLTKQRIEELRKQVFRLNIEIDMTKNRTQKKDGYDESGRLYTTSSSYRSANDVDYAFRGQGGGNYYKLKTFPTPNYGSRYASPYAVQNIDSYNSGDASNTVGKDYLLPPSHSFRTSSQHSVRARSASASRRSVSSGGRSVSSGGRSVSSGGRSVSSGGRSVSSGGRSVSSGGRSRSSSAHPKRGRLRNRSALRSSRQSVPPPSYSHVYEPYIPPPTHTAGTHSLSRVGSAASVHSNTSLGGRGSTNLTMNMLNRNQRAWGQYQTREQVREWRDPNDAQEIELAIARRRAEEARAREEKIRRNTENRTLRRQNLRTAVKQMQLDKHEGAMQVIKEENEGVKYLIAQNEAQLKKNQSVRNFIRDNDPHRKAYLQMMAERAEAERRERQFLHGEISRLESIEKRLKRELRATLRAEEQRERGVRTREARRRAEEQARRAEELRLVEAQQRERRREEFEQERERRRLQGEIEKLMQMERNLEEQIRTVGRTDEDEG